MENKVAKGIKIGALVIIGIIAFTWVVQLLWNWLMPEIFGLDKISWLQAGGLLILSKILFGGFHKGAKSHGRCHSNKHYMYQMSQKWSRMSPEQQEKMKQRFKNRWCKTDISCEFEEEDLNSDTHVTSTPNQDQIKPKENPGQES